MTPAGPVAVVTGAARGVGRGIALVLGELAATVYVTDRESRGSRHSELPGTVEDTAEQLTERGGRGIPVPLDHRDDAAVAACSPGSAPNTAGSTCWSPTPATATRCRSAAVRSGRCRSSTGHNMVDVGVRSHLVAAWHAAPLLIERRGLLVLTGYTDPAADVLAGHVFYDLAMHAVDRLAAPLAHDLGPHGVTALAVAPGFTRTEAILAALGDALPAGTDSVEFPGRAVRALLTDPDVGDLAGSHPPGRRARHPLRLHRRDRPLRRGGSVVIRGSPP